MQKRTFPSLPEGLETRLSAVELLMGDDPGYLDAPDCPYSPKLKDFLRRLAVKPTKFTPVELFSEDMDAGGRFETVLEELEKTMAEFKGIEPHLSDAEPKDRIDFFKAKTALIERWITQKERIFTMREMSSFQSVVLGVLDEFLNVDQKQELKSRLKRLESVQ